MVIYFRNVNSSVEIVPLSLLLYLPVNFVAYVIAIDFSVWLCNPCAWSIITKIIIYVSAAPAAVIQITGDVNIRNVTVKDGARANIDLKDQVNITQLNSGSK